MLDISLNNMMYVCISLFAFISEKFGKKNVGNDQKE